MSRGLHLNLDDAWLDEPFRLPVADAREWGPRLRFSAPAHAIENFFAAHKAAAAPFILYGSGDFHHLSALWLRRFSRPLTLVSFDNHPDWDIRPPKWSCGGWVNRALDLPHVQQVAVWGCGNFECWWPGQIFGNRAAEKSGRLAVHPWADDRPAAEQERRGAIRRDNWRERFTNFVATLNRRDVYVTIDLDCLSGAEIVTNWETGRFTAAEVRWALEVLREKCHIVGGDMCGAYSTPRYARWKQKFAAEFDHPKLEQPEVRTIQRLNHTALRTLWPALAE